MLHGLALEGGSEVGGAVETGGGGAAKGSGAGSSCMIGCSKGLVLAVVP